LVTFQANEGQVELARALKYASDLSLKRVIEKLEIERRYWLVRGVDWGIVTPRDIPRSLATNCRELHDCVDLDGYDLSVDDILDIVTVLKPKILDGERPLRHCARECDKELGHKPGTGLRVAYHMIATRQWLVDLSVQIETDRPLCLLETSIDGEEGSDAQCQ
jgi:hypothetical protein